MNKSLKCPVCNKRLFKRHLKKGMYRGYDCRNCFTMVYVYQEWGKE